MSLWTPLVISPHTWIDFSDTSTLFDATSGGSAVTNGVGIARAEDKSGNGRHFTQATSGARMTFASALTNGLGGAICDGGDYLTSVSANSVWTFLHNSFSTVFVVNKSGTTADPIAFYSWLGNSGGGSGNIGYSIAYDDRNLLPGMTDAFFVLISQGVLGNVAVANTNAAATAVVTDFRNVITPNSYRLFTLRSDPTNATPANRFKFSASGGGLVGNNERTGAASASAPSFALQIGALGNNVLPFVGDYLELLIFNSLLSTENQQLVEGYLAWKWGLQANLPSDHPYKSGAPTTGAQRRVINDGLFNRGLFGRSLVR